MTCGVYKLETDNGEIYVGSSKNIEKRIKEHVYTCRKKIHKNDRIQRAFLNGFGHKILIVCAPADLFLYEQICIDALNPSLNISMTAGEQDFNGEIRKRMSEGSRKRWSDPEQRRKMSLAQTGKKHSDVTKRKISQNSKRFLSSEIGKQHLSRLARMSAERGASEETRKKMSERAQGRIISPEARKKMSIAAKGRRLSSEHKAKISEGGKRAWREGVRS
jgi:group I intron endonuclease